MYFLFKTEMFMLKCFEIRDPLEEGETNLVRPCL